MAANDLAEALKAAMQAMAEERAAKVEALVTMISSAPPPAPPSSARKSFEGYDPYQAAADEFGMTLDEVHEMV